MTGFIKFRQNNFSAIESLAQNLKSTLQELARLEKDNKYLFLQAEATMVSSLAKNAASSINHLVRLNLDNEKAIAVMKTVANYLHTAYIRVYKYTGYIAQKLEQLLHEAFNLLPSGMTLQPELFAPNEINPLRDNKTPILDVIAKWFKDNAQRWAFQQQQKLDKQYLDCINNGKQKPPVAVQLCLDLESITPTPVQPVDSVKETNYIDLEKIIDSDRNEDFIKKLEILVKARKYPKQITSAAYSLMDLARPLFSELERSQKLSQTSRSSDRYYALPIQTFISFQAFEDYFENERIVSNISFRDILAKYVYTLALAFNILPIDSNYQNIPYVVFNSAAMDKLGKSLFNDNQIFQSKEMNILNLILSQED